jgi:hypothetical protein
VRNRNHDKGKKYEKVHKGVKCVQTSSLTGVFTYNCI